MNSEAIAAIKHVFDLNLEPLWKEHRVINETLAGEGGVVHILRDHGEILGKRSEVLHGIDARLTNVERILAGVEILFRKQTG